MVLRRAFLAASTAWAAALPLAAFAASRPAAASAAYGFALSMYAIGRVICHQLPVRSFHLWGASLPVCARCTGIYLGSAAGAILLHDSHVRARANRYDGHARVVLLAAAVPTAATLVFEWTTGITPPNWVRAAAGVPLGAAVAWAIGMVN